MVLTPRSPGAPPPKPQRRSSILAFRPSTSPGLPPPPSSSHSHAAIPAIPRTASTDALRRLAQDLNLKDPREVDRWSAFFPLQDTPEEEQVIYAEASQRISTSGTPSLLSLGRSLVRRASTSLNRPGKSRKRSQDIDVPLPLTLTLPISVPVTDRNRPVTATTDIIIGSPPQPRHSISKRPSFLRRMKSLSRTRRDAVSNPSGQGAADCSFLPQPPPILGQQLHQLDWQRPGAAARASAAAAANANMHPGRPGLLTRKDTKCSRAGTPGHFMEMAYSKVDYAMEVDSVIEPLDNTGPGESFSFSKLLLFNNRYKMAYLACTRRRVHSINLPLHQFHRARTLSFNFRVYLLNMGLPIAP